MADKNQSFLEFMGESRNEFTEPIKTLFTGGTQALADKSKEVATNLVEAATPYLEHKEDDGKIISWLKTIGQIWIPMVASAVEAIGSAPDTVWDIVSSPFDDDKSRWWDKLKDSYNAARDRWENRFSAAVSAIDENNNDDSIFGEIWFQLLNNPLLWRWIGKAGSAAGKLIKWTSKIANVADDAVKAGKLATKAKNAWKFVGESLIEMTASKPVYDTLKTAVKGVKRWIQEKSLWSGVREVLWSAVDLWSNALFNPWSRAGTAWTTYTASENTAPLLDRAFGWKESAVKQNEFAEKNGYSLKEIANISDPNELKYFYDTHNIPEEWRITQVEAQKAVSDLSDNTNFASKSLRWINDLYESIDPFSHAAKMYNDRQEAETPINVERSEWRGEVRWFSSTSSVDNSTTWSTVSQNSNVSVPSVTQNSEVETSSSASTSTTQPTSWPVTKRDKTVAIWWREFETYWKYKGLEKTEATAELNYYAVNGVLDTETQRKYMTGKSAAYEQTIISNLNDAAKQHVSELIELFTPEEINKHPEIQREIVKDMNARKDLFNALDPYIEKELGKDDLDKIGAIRMKEIMDQAYNDLPEETQKTIDKNLYQRAIKYNTDLEKGVDYAVMESAYYMNQVLEWTLDIFKSKSRERWYDSGVAWLSSIVINPEQEWIVDRIIDASYVAEEKWAQMLGMVVTNWINEWFIEKYADKALSKVFQKRWGLSQATKAGITEMLSEPMETMQDAMAMLKNPDTEFDFTQSLLVWWAQGFLSAFANSTRQDQSIKDFVSDPANRTAVLNAMGLYPDEIEDPADRALFLATVNKAFDQCIPVLEEIMNKTDDWVGTIAKSFAGYQSKKLLWAYNSDILNQIFEAIKNTPDEQKMQWFASERDYNRAQAGKDFQLNPTMIQQITKSPENQKKLADVQKLVTAYCDTAKSLKGSATIQDFIDKMFPKVDKNWNKVQTTLYPTIDSDSHIAESLKWNPIYDTAMITMKTGTTPITIGSLLNMTSDNPKVYGRSWALWIWTVNKFKAQVEVLDEDTGKNVKVPMQTYLRSTINTLSAVDPSTWDFLNNLFFESGNIDNSYMFMEDGSLSPLWEKLLEQTIPEVSTSWLKPAYQSAIQKLKEIDIIKQTTSDIETKGTFQDGESQVEDVEHNSNSKDNIPVSIDPNDYPDIDWMNDVVEIIEWLNKAKKGIPTLINSNKTVWVPLDKRQSEVLDNIIWDQELNNIIINMDQCFKNWRTSYTIEQDYNFPKVTVGWKEYSLVMFNHRAITKQEFSNANHDVWFASFYLVDFNNETLTIDVTNNIRPSAKPKKYNGQKRWQYYHNNRCCSVTTKNGEYVDDERVLNFTYWYNDKTNQSLWKLSSILTLENLNPKQISKKMKEHKVFLQQPRDWVIYGTNYIGQQQVKFDRRDINTTSDIVLNPDNKSIKISSIEWDVLNLDISGKKFDNTKLTSKQNDNILDYLNALWTRVQDADYFGKLSQKWNLTEEEKQAILDQAAENTEMTESEVADSINSAVQKNKVNYKKVVEAVSKKLWSWDSISEEVLKLAFPNYEENWQTVRWYSTWEESIVSAEKACDIAAFKNGKTVAQIADEHWILIVNDPRVHNVINPNTWATATTSRTPAWDTFIMFKWYCDPTTAIHELYHAVAWDSVQRVNIQKELANELPKDLAKRKDDTFTEEFLADTFRQYFALWTFYTRGVTISDWLKQKIIAHFDSILDWKAGKYNKTKTLEFLKSRTGIDDITVIEYRATPEDVNTMNEMYLWLLADNGTIIDNYNTSNSNDNKEYVDNSISDPTLKKNILDDCETLWISLGILPPETLYEFLDCYKNWKGFEDVLTLFASKLPSTVPEQKFLNILIQNWILKADGVYNGLSLSQSLSLLATKKFIWERTIKTIADSVGFISDVAFEWEENVARERLMDAICNYYITTNLWMTYSQASSQLKAKVKEVVEQKLLDENTYIMKPESWEHSDMNIFTDIFWVDNDVRAAFASEAYNRWQDKTPLISASECNYLMQTNALMTVIGRNEESLWQLCEQVLQAINVPEFANATYINAYKWKQPVPAETKLELIFKIYNYLAYNRKADYQSMFDYLYQELSYREWWSALMSILADDLLNKSHTQPHSDDTLVALKTISKEDYKWTWNKFANQYKNDTEEIIKNLKLLEQADENSFLLLISFAPVEIKDVLYRDFQNENAENKTDFIPIKLVQWLYNNRERLRDFIRNSVLSQDDQKKVTDIMEFIEDTALVNPMRTETYSSILWIPALDRTKGTVMYYSGDSENPGVAQYSKYPIMMISDIQNLKSDVNILYKWSLPEDLPEDIKKNCIKLPNSTFIEDGKMCVPDIGSKILETNNLMYDYLGLKWLNIEHKENSEFQLTDEIKNKVAALKNNDELYWLIFKNYIQPNYSELKEVSRSDFTSHLNSESFNKVNDNDIYSCVAGRTLEDMITSAIWVINVVTDWVYDMDVNSQSTIKELDIDGAWKKFTNIYSQISSNKDKKAFANMFADYILAINQKFKSEKEQAQWFNEFRTTHRNTILKMYDMINWEDTQLDDIDWLLFKDVVLKDWEEINQKQEEIEQNRLIQIYNSPEYTETEQILKNAQAEKRKIEAEIEKLKKKYKTELDEYDASLMRLNDYMETVNPWTREYAQLEKRWDDINTEKEKFIRENITSVVPEWSKTSLSKQLYDVDNTIRLAEWKLRALTADEHLIGTAYIDDSKVQGDERWAIGIEEYNSSSVLLEWNEEWSANKAFEDKTIKVLSWIKQNCVKSSCKTVWSTKRWYIRWKLYNNDLLNLVEGKDAVTVELSLENIANVRKSDNWFDKSNLTKFVNSLANLKKRNPQEFRSFIFGKMFPYMNYSSEQFAEDENTLLLRQSATSVYENPYNFYAIYNNLANNPEITMDWLSWFSFSPNIQISSAKIEWLKQSASQEFINTSPYIKKTETGIDNMELHVDEYRQKYSQYFNKNITPSDEQLIKMNALVEAFTNKGNTGKSIFLPGIAWAGKTTLVTAFLKRVEDTTGMVSEKRRIENWKQTAIILNTNEMGNKIADLEKDSDGYVYMKVGSTKWADPLYIRFKPGSVHYRFYDQKNNKTVDTISNLNLDEVVKATGDAYSKEATEAMLDLWQWAWPKKDGYFTEMDNKTVYIENIEPAKDIVWKKIHDVWWAMYKDWAWSTRDRYKQPATFECNSWLTDILFASEKHSTTNALMDLFQWSFGNIPTSTIDSFFVQPSWRSIADYGYRRYTEIRPDKITKWQVIIIDETQNTDSEKMQKFKDVMGKDNTIIFLGDFHQMWDGKFLEKNVKLEDYISETHRATDDINLWNKVNAFTFNSLVDAWAIGWYLTDSEDFITWDWIENNQKAFDKPVKDTLYVCKTNKRRKQINDLYLEHLGWMNEIINKGKTLQVMVAEMRSDSKEERWAKGQMPDEWLNMKWFTQANINWLDVYEKKVNGVTQYFVPHSNWTDGNDRTVIAPLMKYAKDHNIKCTVFVPAFAITTTKESWKTVNNIILDEEVTNSDYDFINKSNVKQFYDAATRWAKHVILPKKSTRLLGITKAQAIDLMNWVPIKWNVAVSSMDKWAVESTIVPRFYKKNKDDLMMYQDLLNWLKQYVSQLSHISNKNKCAELVDELVSIMETIQTSNSPEIKRQFAETYKELLKTSKFDYTNKKWETHKYNIMDAYMRKLWDVVKWNSDKLAEAQKKINTFEQTVFGTEVDVPKGEKLWSLNAHTVWSNRDKEWNPIIDKSALWIYSTDNTYYEVEKREENWRIEYNIKLKDVERERMHRNWWIDYVPKEIRQDSETEAVKNQASRLMDEKAYPGVVEMLNDIKEELETINYTDEVWMNVLLTTDEYNKWPDWNPMIVKSNLAKQFDKVISRLENWVASKDEVLELIDNAEAILHQDLTAGIVEQEYDINVGWVEDDYENNFTCW